MRLRALGALSFLMAILLLAPSALADEAPPIPTPPTDPVPEPVMELVEEAMEKTDERRQDAEETLQPEGADDEDEERASEDDDRDDDSVQQVLQEAATLDDSVEQVLTDLDLLAIDEEALDDTGPAAPQTTDDGTDAAPLTQADAAPRSIDLVTTTVIAAAAAGALAAVSKAGLLRFLSPAALGLFSRFQGPKVLENPRRAELNRLVCKSPGITVPDLCKATALSRNAVLHHLRMLEDQGMIVHRRMGRSTHWFENGGRYGRDRKDAYAVLHDDRTRDVAQFILRHPGSHQGAIGTALGLSPSVIHWHMKRLEDAALVQRQRDGRSVLCYPGGPLGDLAL